MNILYITSVPLEYSSSANLRNIALIRGLIQNGHRVSTLSTRPQNVSAYYDKTILDIAIDKRFFVELGQIHARMTSTQKRKLVSKVKGMLHRAYTAISIYDPRKNEVPGVSKIDFSNEKFDLVISSSDPKSSHLFAEQLLKTYPKIAKRWIQYWGDPFTGDINRRSILPDFVVASEERRLLSLCDKAVYVSPLTSEYIKRKYPDYAGKVQFIPVGYSQEKIYAEHESNTLDLCYCGDYYSKDRDIMPLIEAVKDLQGVCTLTIAGNSDISMIPSDNITNFPRVEKKKVDEIESNSDVIVCVCNRAGTQIPGKIYHASATNRVILILLDGENKNEIKQYFDGYNRFVFAENTKQQVLQSLMMLQQKKPTANPCEQLSGYHIAKEILK